MFELWSPKRCRSSLGDCTVAVRELDDVEYAPLADSTDLGKRDTVEFIMPEPVSGRAGVVLAARHSFVSTFLFYESLAFAGSKVGELLGALERGDPRAAERTLGLTKALGGIDVFFTEGGEAWRWAGTFDEAGPIATDLQVIPFEATGAGPIRIRLEMARGAWRIDQVGLALIGPATASWVLEPARVTRDGSVAAAALAALQDPDQYLVTGPGDHYRVEFQMPEAAADFQLFLESTGYYYEWMRGEWLRKEDPVRLALVLMNPREALKQLAPSFKAVEAEIEQQFWASRFRR